MAFLIDNDPAKTYNIQDFIKMQSVDNLTFRNFSLIEVINGIELLDHNVIDDYMFILKSSLVTVKLEYNDYVKYKYSPDRLAYDVYGSGQLDFLVLSMNDIIDNKDFDFHTIKLVRNSTLKAFLSEVYNAERNYLENNKYVNGVDNNVN